MNKQELLKALEIQKGVLKETQTHLDNIEQEIKKIDDNDFEPTPKTWTPNVDEVFWVADLGLEPVVFTNCEGFISRNRRLIKFNRIFKTLEECQLYCDIQKAFRDTSREFKYTSNNYYLWYDHTTKK